ncbi:MAG: hypothetical protein K1X94_10260 [Sandaracinaceae bacterium]|nr:hypothetical protein [Sandaracinaceae bacterium]
MVFRSARVRVLLPAVVGLALALASPSPRAHANLQPLTDGRARLGVGSWPDVLDPARRDARLLLRAGIALLLQAMSPEAADGLEPPTQLSVERALERFDRAADVLTDDVELAVYRGIALGMFVHEEAGGRATRRTDEAIAELERARSLDPRYEPATVAWQLALLHARERRYDRAAEEYERARRRTAFAPVPVTLATDQEEILCDLFLPPSPGLLAVNQAEVEMLGLDLAHARAHYEEAIDGTEQGSLPRALALFGLALAEERAGSHLEAMSSAEAAATAWTPSARDTIAQALVAEHGPVAALHHPGVTYEPRWERHAYEALVHEALAARAADDEHREAERARARRALRMFFTVGGTASPYAEVARAALARLDGAQASIGPSSSPLWTKKAWP